MTHCNVNVTCHYYYYIEFAVCHQPQAVMSHYEIHDPNGPVAIDMSNDGWSSVSTSGPVQGNMVDPYHVPPDELLAIRIVSYYSMM